MVYYNYVCTYGNKILAYELDQRAVILVQVYDDGFYRRS